MDTIKSLLLEAPDGHMSASVKTLIEKWDDEPKSLNVLELLDAIVLTGGGSAFLMGILQELLTRTLNKEGVSLEETITLATWRHT